LAGTPLLEKKSPTRPRPQRLGIRIKTAVWQIIKGTEPSPLPISKWRKKRENHASTRDEEALKGDDVERIMLG